MTLNQNLPAAKFSIMKNPAIAVAVLFAVISLSHASAPVLSMRPSGAINDYAGILSSETKNSLESFCTSLNAKTGVAIVVVTTPSLNGSDIEGVTADLYKQWGIGSKSTDEGVLLLVSVQDRLVRIETGYGSEGYITDAQSSQIIRNIASPLFGAGKWDEGLYMSVKALAELAAKEKNISLAEISEDHLPQFNMPVSQARSVPVIPAIIMIVIFIIMMSTKTGRTILLFMLISSLNSSGRSSGGGGFGGGFGGGGFGGFGGGRSGGGGASGRF